MTLSKHAKVLKWRNNSLFIEMFLEQLNIFFFKCTSDLTLLHMQNQFEYDHMLIWYKIQGINNNKSLYDLHVGKLSVCSQYLRVSYGLPPSLPVTFFPLLPPPPCPGLLLSFSGSKYE